MGTGQSGLPNVALASLVNDQEVLELARSAAQQTIDQDGDLAQHPQLQQELTYRYQKLMGGAILT
jgi:ATP-dependent DNA helicase RecG